MPCPDFFILPFIRLFHQVVEQGRIDEVGARELLSVAIQLFDKGAGRVHAERLGLQHLELEIHKELHVLVKTLDGINTVSVVLAKHVQEVGQRDLFISDFEDNGGFRVAWHSVSALALCLSGECK